jgi:hypothetical protein
MKLSAERIEDRCRHEHQDRENCCDDRHSRVVARRELPRRPGQPEQRERDETAAPIEALLQEARRLARRRVLIVENVPEQGYERVACRTLDWVFNRPFGIPTPFTFRTIEQWGQVAVEMGMTKEHVQRFRLPWPALGLFPDALMVWDLRVLDAVLPQE